MKSDGVFIKHILEEISFLKEESKDLEYDGLLGNETLKRAFARSIEIIGEASKNISPEFKKKHLEVEWSRIAGMRDKLIHEYFGVDWEIVWNVIESKLPEFETILLNVYKKEFEK